MAKKSVMLTVAWLATVWVAPSTAAAAEVIGPVAPPPSPFETGTRGFGMGVAAGLAGGYLVARANGWQSSDWRPLLAGGAIGALAGGALGLTLGFVDNASPPAGRSYLVMRDMALGSGFGTIFGALVGGLVALDTDHPENILFGAAIGTLAGTAVGLVFGTIERNPWATGGLPPRAVGWNLGVVPLPTVAGTLSMGPCLSGFF